MKFGIVIFTLLNAMVGLYVARQLTHFTQLGPTGKALLASSIMLLFMLFIGSFALSMQARMSGAIPPFIETLFEIGLTCMAYINFVIVLVFLRDFISIVLQYTSTFDTYKFYTSTASFLVLVSAALLMALGHVVVRVGPRVISEKIYYKNLPSQLEGFKIVHLTDMHIGATMPASRIWEAVKKAQAEKADMIVLTGDIIDAYPHLHQEEMKALGTLTAPYGVYVVLGNHEYYWNAQKSIEAFQSVGIRVLLNETDSQVVNGQIIQVSGIPDPAAVMLQMETPNFKTLQETLNEESFKIFLAHQPFVADEAAQFGFDLQLSGHTHGGQFFPWNFLIGFFQKYPKGLYQVGNMQLYVNQGTGYWGPPLRLGTVCEITSITLHSSNPETTGAN